MSEATAAAPAHPTNPQLLHQPALPTHSCRTSQPYQPTAAAPASPTNPQLPHQPALPAHSCRTSQPYQPTAAAPASPTNPQLPHQPALPAPWQCRSTVFTFHTNVTEREKLTQEMFETRNVTSSFVSILTMVGYDDDVDAAVNVLLIQSLHQLPNCRIHLRQLLPHLNNNNRTCFVQSKRSLLLFTLS